jgi:hypothetical protein
MPNVTVPAGTTIYSRRMRGGALREVSSYGLSTTITVSQSVQALVKRTGGGRPTKAWVNEVLHHGSRTGRYILSEAVRQEEDQTPSRHTPRGPHQVNW